MKLMFYAECEPYHFLSISLTAFIGKAKSRDRIRATEAFAGQKQSARNRSKTSGFLLIEGLTPAIFFIEFVLIFFIWSGEGQLSY